MKLAVLFHRFGPYHIARLNAAAAAGRGELISVELSGAGGEYGWEYAASAGLKRVTVYSDGDSNNLPRGELDTRIRATLDGIAPDVLAVAGWGDRGMRQAAAWGRKHGISMVLMSDSQHHDERRVWWKEWVKRRYVASFRAGFVAGTTHAAYLSKLGMPVESIYDGYDVVDNDYFARGADAARADAGRLRDKHRLPDRFFLTCARFVAKKNLATLLEAYARYRCLVGDRAWDLVLVGDGPLRPKLEQLRASLGLATSVRLVGFRQYDELPVYYGLASAFVLPSIQEQWGLVVNEALAAGLPVLASRICGCVPDLLADLPAAAVDPHDPATLAEQMLSITASPADISANRSRVAAWGLERFVNGLWGAAHHAAA